MDQHYHPLLYQRLRSLFDARDWDSLPIYLGGLSNAHFRTAGYLIGERLLQATSPADFWEVMRRLILWQPKAFTVTVGKAALPRLQSGELSLSDSGFDLLAQALASPKRAIDRQKLLRLWLPAMRHPQTMEQLFSKLGITAPRRRVDFLLHTESLPAAFLLLRNLRFEEHDRDYLCAICRQVMKRGGDLSFNQASLLRTFFDLQDIRGTFSLTLNPYELSRLDTDYEVFCRAITKV